MPLKTARVLAIVAVTAALCADQVAVAAPAARPQAAQIADLAGRVVRRLHRNLRQSVPIAVRQLDRDSAQTPPVAAPPVVIAASPSPHRLISPFQFRLPPPACA